MVCQWWIDFDYYNSRGQRYYHIQGAAHDVCSRTGVVKWDVRQIRFESGPACATLFKATPGGVATVVRQCHNIHR